MKKSTIEALREELKDSQDECDATAEQRDLLSEEVLSLTATLKGLVEVLIKIRDSTFRDAASLRAIADDGINKYKKENPE